MLPIINDQPLIADRVEELGAGILLDIQQLSAKELAQGLKEVLQNPIYKINAEKISESLREAGGYSKAADKILLFTASING